MRQAKGVLPRSSLIHFACIGVAPPRVFTPQARGIKKIHASLWSCPSRIGWMVETDTFFQKARETYANILSNPW